MRVGENVLLRDRTGRRYWLRLAAGATYSLHSGTVAHDQLIGQPEGNVVKTSRGVRLLALRPTLAERLLDRPRQAQPIYAKDRGTVLTRADIYPGARVLEAGTGAGALTLTLLRAVGTTGQLISYELREDLQQAARQTIIELWGELPVNLELRLGDIYQGIPEVNWDRVLLDLPEPWQVAPHLPAALRPGGIVFAHCPNVDQAQRFLESLRSVGGFGVMETVELLERSWTIRDRSLRPSHRMVAHTGFLTFARRLAGTERFEVDSDGF
ncbi:MAG: tRNA (adenine-N1)-methyltransferase [Candidatus Dormibacteraceae bacterium]